MQELMLTAAKVSAPWTATPPIKRNHISDFIKLFTCIYWFTITLLVQSLVGLLDCVCDPLTKIKSYVSLWLLHLKKSINTANANKFVAVVDTFAKLYF